MGRRAESREALAHLAAEAARYREARNTARSEALIRAEREVEAQRLEFQRQIALAIRANHSVSAIADVTGLGRTTVYKWMDEYDKIAPIELEATDAKNPWRIEYARDGMWRIIHPSMGAYLAQFELVDDSLTIWREGGVYRPISREHEDRSEDGPWDAEYELVYAPLRAEYDQWVAAGRPDVWGRADAAQDGDEPYEDDYSVGSLDFLDDDEA